MSKEFIWSSYPDHLRELFEWMLISDELSDVTFITDDAVMVKANRFVLSAASPLLKELLKTDSAIKSEEKVILLKGIQYSEIKSIIQFIYLGVTKCNKERLNELRTAAETLQIKDLHNRFAENIDIENTCIEYVQDELLETSENLEYKGEKSFEESCFEDSSNDSAKNVSKNVVKIFKENFESGSNSENISTGNINFNKPEDVKYSCTFMNCDYIATQSGAVYNHIKSAHENKKYPCSLCDYQATYKSSLAKHNQSVHEGVKYPCQQCDHEATQQSSLTRHIQSIHDGKKFHCEVCNKEFASKGYLHTHAKSAHNKTTGRRKYPYAKVMHDGQTFYQCYKCKREFEAKDKTIYQSHMHNCGHCSFCGKTYNRKQSWLNCEASHTNSYRLFCSWCGKGFTEHHRMQRHERIHTGQTPYQCNECGKRFKQSNQLKSHMRIHTGETPFQCEICCKKFKFASTKSKHKCGPT